VSLLQNLNKANYNLPIMVTDSGKPPMTNITDLRVQVCSCKNSKVDCNGAGALHLSLSLLLLFSLLSLLSGKSAWLHMLACAPINLTT
jgi:cadherin 13 (H-cadherin)